MLPDRRLKQTFFKSVVCLLCQTSVKIIPFLTEKERN